MMVAGDGRFGIGLSVGIHHRPVVHHAGPFQGAGVGPRAWFDCAVLEAETAPVVIADHDIPVPADRWELRTSGLWADHICETPFRHWSYGLEAFGLSVDDPRELLGRGFGDRVPLGWELEFEGRSDRVKAIDAGSPGASGPAAYGQPGRVHGLVLFAGRSEPVDGPAIRQHWWGPTTAAPIDALDRQADGVLDHRAGGTAAHEVALPVPGGVWWVSKRGTAMASRTDPTPTDRP